MFVFMGPVLELLGGNLGVVTADCMGVDLWAHRLKYIDIRYVKEQTLDVVNHSLPENLSGV